MRFGKRPISFTPFPALLDRPAPARSKAKIIAFFPKQIFLARVKAGEFLEHAKVHEHYYGTLRQPLIDNLKKA
jgi:Guanylate kinase